MKSHFTRIALILLSFLATTLAQAETVRGTVPANKSTVVGFFNVLSGEGSTCQQPQKPEMQIVTAPQHGSVTFRWARHKWNGMRSACKGVGVAGMEIIYTPARGYHGPDRFKIGAQYAQYVEASGSSYASGSYELNVK
jgi:hypothetical protein